MDSILEVLINNQLLVYLICLVFLAGFWVMTYKVLPTLNNVTKYTVSSNFVGVLVVLSAAPVVNILLSLFVVILLLMFLVHTAGEAVSTMFKERAYKGSYRDKP